MKTEVRIELDSGKKLVLSMQELKQLRKLLNKEFGMLMNEDDWLLTPAKLPDFDDDTPALKFTNEKCAMPEKVHIGTTS